MRLRTLATAMTLLTAGSVIGVTTQRFASASVSSGDRTVFIPIAPCRLADTRPAPNQTGPRSAPLAAGDTHTIAAQQTGVPCSGLIPTGASALSLNVTALNASTLSFLTIWPGGDRPVASSLNPAPGQPPVPNAVTTDLSVDQTFEVFNESGSVNIVVDVNGYYVDHNHDDRYYTKAEVDTAVDVSTATAPWSESMPIASAFWFDSDTGARWSFNPVGLALQNGGSGGFFHGFTLPPSYQGGADVKIGVSWMADTDNVVGCTFRLEARSLSAFRPGVPILEPDGAWDGPAVPILGSPFVILTATNEGNPIFYFDNIVHVAQLFISGTELLPGDEVRFAVTRRSDPSIASQDTCTEDLKILALTAEPA